uniref:Uncharacterized protein n=1 Tax=Eptatretus burgeri TaxID=7764 RepID=A0A8C4QEW2_EPTBU
MHSRVPRISGGKQSVSDIDHKQMINMDVVENVNIWSDVEGEEAVCTEPSAYSSSERADLSSLVRLQTELLESRSMLRRENSNSQQLKDQLRKMESKRNGLQQELDNLQEKHVELKMKVAELETQLESARFTAEQEGERWKADKLYKHDLEHLQEQEENLQQVLRREQNLRLEMEKQQLERNILLGNVKQLKKQRDEMKQHFLLEQNTWLAREEELQKILELERRRNAKAFLSVCVAI